MATDDTVRNEAGLYDDSTVKRKGKRCQRPPRKSKRSQKAAPNKQEPDPPPSSTGPCPICRAEAGCASDLSFHLLEKHTAKQLADQIANTVFKVFPTSLVTEQGIHQSGGLESDRSEVERDGDADVDHREEELAKCDETEAAENVEEIPPPPTNKFTCTACGKTLSSKGNLTKHQAIHSATKAFPCPDCAEGFNRKRDLDCHRMQRHTGERPHTCKFCGKGFVHKFYLKEHLGYHTGERRHQCPTCGKSFHSGSGLAKHMSRHNGGEKNIRCGQCDKMFSVAIDLRAHVKFVHDKVGRDSSAIPVFPPNSGLTRGSDLVPENYVPIPQEENKAEEQVSGGGYEKPRPVLRMVEPVQTTSKSTEGESAAAAVPEASSAADEAERRRLQKEMEVQQQIEEWMISQGVTFGGMEAYRGPSAYPNMAAAVEDDATTVNCQSVGTGGSAARALNQQ